MTQKIQPEQLSQAGAIPGQVLTWNDLTGWTATNTVKGFEANFTGTAIVNRRVVGAAKVAFTSNAVRSSQLTWALTPAAAAAVFIVKRNDTQVATVTFAKDARYGVWSAAVTWVFGDRITIEAPQVADSALADVFIGTCE